MFAISGFAKQSIRKFLAFPSNVDRLTMLQQHQSIHTLLAEPRYADPKRLNKFEQQVFSQNGEDGVLAEIFRRIGTTDKYFLEIGVGDGLENNTTFFLAQGWKGVWIDGDQAGLAKARSHFWQPIKRGDLVIREAMVTAENIKGMLEELKVPVEFDLFSLDIDRNTWYIWNVLRHLRPRVIVVEYNSTFPAGMDWKVEYDANRCHNCTAYMGASLKAYETLGRETGYSLVGCELGGINAFLVRNDLLGDKFCAPYTSENHYEPPRFFLLRRDGHPRCYTDIPQPV